MENLLQIRLAAALLSQCKSKSARFHIKALCHSNSIWVNNGFTGLLISFGSRLMEIKMGKSIMVLILFLKISASVWTHRGLSDTYGPSHMFLYVVAVLRSGTLMDAVEMRCCVTSLFSH